MAWWDHEELKAPEDRSARYKAAFPEEYVMKNLFAQFTVYKVREVSSQQWVRTYNRETFETKGAAKNGRNTIARSARMSKDGYEIVEFSFYENAGQVVD